MSSTDAASAISRAYRPMPQQAGGDLTSDPYGDPGSGFPQGGGVYDQPDVTQLQQIAFNTGRNPWEVNAGVQQVFDALPPAVQQGGVQTDEFHFVDPATLTVYELGRANDGSPSWRMLSDADSKRYLQSLGVDPTGGGSVGGSGGGSFSGGGSPYAAQQMDLQERQFAHNVEQDRLNSVLDALAAVRAQQTLATQAAQNNTQNLIAAAPNLNDGRQYFGGYEPNGPAQALANFSGYQFTPQALHTMPIAFNPNPAPVDPRTQAILDQIIGGTYG